MVSRLARARDSLGDDRPVVHFGVASSIGDIFKRDKLSSMSP